jgi:hypothetical protein
MRKWRLSSGRIVWLAVVLAGPPLHAGCSRPPEAGAPASARNVAAPEPVYDKALTDGARVLAGMMPEQHGRFSKVTRDAEWKDYKAEFDRTWTQTDRERFQAMRTWRDGELRTAAPGPCDTLFYPFSGPDIVNAWVLFPDCSRYVMFGLERIGTFPNLGSMTPARVDRLLVNVRHVVVDLFERNYFITKHMMSELTTPELDGTLPVLSLLLARLGSRIVAATPLELNTSGDFVSPGTTPASGQPVVPAIRIDTLSPAGKAQQIIYLRVQADNVPLARRAGMGVFLARLRPYRTVIKSASFLMHGDGFSRIRGELLAGSSLIVQDDTGIPFSFVNTPEWDLRLYGTFRKPIKEFSYVAEDDLEAAYATPGRARPLAFTWGYHWQQTGTSHLMLAIRRKPEQGR